MKGHNNFMFWTLYIFFKYQAEEYKNHGQHWYSKTVSVNKKIFYYCLHTECMVDWCFNYWLICFYTLMRQMSLKGLSNKYREFELLLYRWCSVTEQFSIRWLTASHISNWASYKGYFRHLNFRCLHWSLPCNWQQRKIKNKL